MWWSPLWSEGQNAVTLRGAGGCVYSRGRSLTPPRGLSVTSLPQTHRSTWMRRSFALIVQYATVNKINIYTRFFWEMSYLQICSLATELIVGSLNVNDTIRATLELLQHAAAGQPGGRAASPFRRETAERFKEDCICDKHHSPFIHHACQT